MNKLSMAKGNIFELNRNFVGWKMGQFLIMILKEFNINETKTIWTASFWVFLN